MLSLASPVFHKVFSTTSGCERSWQAPQVLFQCLYPVTKPTVEDLRFLERLVAAAEKYETGVVLSVAKSGLVAPGNLEKDILRVYSIACTSRDLWNEATIAAKCMTFGLVASAHSDDIARTNTVDRHRPPVYLVRREKEAKFILKEPLSVMFSIHQCTGETETRLTSGNRGHFNCVHFKPVVECGGSRRVGSRAVSEAIGAVRSSPEEKRMRRS